jgi:hypothetical protein
MQRGAIETDERDAVSSKLSRRVASVAGAPIINYLMALLYDPDTGP